MYRIEVSTCRTDEEKNASVLLKRDEETVIKRDLQLKKIFF
jgi:hypothetical protein